jgi:Tfp pilus assembly protein PilO
MSTATEATRRFSALTNPIRNLILGRQNERIEFLMDSYFKLPPEGRTAVIVGSVVLSIIGIIGVIAVYISALGSLQEKLDQSFAATNRLRELQQSYAIVDSSFKSLERQISAANEGLVLISVLEQKAKELGLSTSGFPPQLPRTELPASNPLSKSYQNSSVEFRVSNASLKKIIELVTAIEATPHMLRVSSLRIRALYQNKLYFDANIEVEGTVTKR